MSNNNLVETIKAQIKKDSTQYKVFNLLSNEQWHCRDCEGKQIGSSQYAGGGGIQGLERGTKSRPGLAIETEPRYCNNCQRITRPDCWTGEIKSANSAANIPDALVQKNFKSLCLYRCDRTKTKVSP